MGGLSIWFQFRGRAARAHPGRPQRFPHANYRRASGGFEIRPLSPVWRYSTIIAFSGPSAAPTEIPNAGAHWFRENA